MAQCTAKSKRSGLQCKSNAMHGKDKCYMHGGATPAVRTTGLYSKYTETRLATKIQEALDDPDILDIRKEIALIRALILDMLERVESRGDMLAMTKDERRILVDFADKSGHLIERYIRITEGSKHVIHIESVQIFLAQIAKVVNDEVSDIKTRTRISKRLGEIHILND